ncbi:MAG: hypothetical protein IPO21_17380 [Bacteroidales bacterium]|nr:hypothetical protein [Bacteroidales bacterium]
MLDEAMTPESFKEGQNFENYVRDYLFPETDYDLVERTNTRLQCKQSRLC